MKLRLFTALLLLPPAVAADTLYKCTDDHGQVLYTNQKGPSKNCTVLSQDQPVSTFVAPKVKAPPPADFPRVSGDQQKARDGDRRAILEQELANEQKQLDNARAALAEQEGRIDPADRGPAGNVLQAKREERLKPHRDSVQLHERNLEALKKEVGGLK